MPALKLGLLGLQGRVGQGILQELSENSSFVLGKGLVRSGRTYQGFPLLPQQLTSQIEEVFETSDVVVDFTHADATTAHLNLALKNKKPFFLGTTGLTAAQGEDLQRAGAHIPLLQASNTSLGAVILEIMAAQVARLLGPEYEIEIREIHHRGKKDAPSGTALSLGTAVAQARGLSYPPSSSFNFSPRRQGPRAVSEIGFSVARGGACKGEHEVLFLGPAEMLRFSHQALDTSLFAKGALKGAQWLLQQPPGLYKMTDVVGMI